MAIKHVLVKPTKAGQLALLAALRREPVPAPKSKEPVQEKPKDKPKPT